MFMEERLEAILQLLKLEGKVIVKSLSEKFNVSEGMIRKDLQKLECEGLIKRTYGGAILERKILNNENTTARVISDLDGKEKISKVVFNEIEENDVIFLDISSTNYAIATVLEKIQKNITIITNMNRICMLFDYSPNVDVIFVGGNYNKKLGGAIGSETIDAIRKFRVNKAFIGTGGINIERNFISNFNLDEANTKKAIMEISKKNYLVVTNEKFYRDGSYKFASLKNINFIITDIKPDEKLMEGLKKYEVEVIY